MSIRPTPVLASVSGLPKVISQIESVLLGKRQQVELAIACLLAGGHLLIEDQPGVGKTTLAHAIAATLGLSWNRVQFTNDLLPADIVGVTLFDSSTQDFSFRPGPVFTSILLADEINRAPPKAQSALLESMEEQQVTLDGNTHELPNPFFVIATQNPHDRLGAYPLPDSQLDRFLAGISLGYPDKATERALLINGDMRSNISKLQPCTNQIQLQQWIEEAKQLHIAEPIYDYVQALLERSRTDYSGLSPRAGLKLLNLARAFALLQGRSHVLPDDVVAVFPALAAHRLTGQVSGGHSTALELLNAVSMP
ncbi:MAG: MoxR family ATPase [Gammaproteobacteria bacterium]|nr:MoxR family ATPase [Gammaproteobacteria bacterium]